MTEGLGDPRTTDLCFIFEERVPMVCRVFTMGGVELMRYLGLPTRRGRSKAEKDVCDLVLHHSKEA